MFSRIDRRTALAGSLATLAASAVLPRTASAAAPSHLPKGSVILFQGDSITDAGRSRDRPGANDPRGLGNGYPFLIGAGLLRDHAGSNLQVLNRGISGHKVPDLQARWQADCIDLQPTILSVLIGVNDIWHKLAGRYDGTVSDYEEGLGALLQQTHEALPSTRIVLCEPFVLRCGAVNEGWFPEFDRRREAAARVAKTMALDWVPFQTMFDQALEQAEPQVWAADGVHPTLAGHALMAKTWREVVGV
jgi:lysophospholipase L1-like esterase